MNNSRPGSIFGRIVLGRRVPEGGYAKHLSSQKIFVSPSARILLETVRPANHLEEVNVSIVPISELVKAFNRDGVTQVSPPFILSHLILNARYYGFGPCLPEVAPRLMESFSHQPKFSGAILAMSAIRGRDGNPEIFRAGHDSAGVNLDTRPMSSQTYPWLLESHNLVFTTGSYQI